jgi:hypothetical protein
MKLLLGLASLLSIGFLKASERGDTIFALAQKTGEVRERYPAFLYARTESAVTGVKGFTH